MRYVRESPGRAVTLVVLIALALAAGHGGGRAVGAPVPETIAPFSNPEQVDHPLFPIVPGAVKVRTMVSGAAKIQEQLRVVSQVDGPQFKMDDDPRISTVGRFLRETYIDEIPQFFNVLFGQMSIVGPRPSPESENTLCPSWRDARLSVRPGITGLWQVHRTREPMKDFQEWIHYDTEYVRNLSLKMDLLTCWQTARKLCENFISQF